MSYRGQNRVGMGATPATADTATMLAQIQRQALDVAATWRPTGFYTPDNVLAIASALSAVQKAVLAPIDQYIEVAESGWTQAAASVIGLVLLPLDPLGLIGVGEVAKPATWLAKQIRNLTREAVQPLLPYVRAAGAARAQRIPYLDAPGLRRVVTDVVFRLQRAANFIPAMKASGSWLTNLTLFVGGAFSVAWGVIKAVVGVVKALVNVALKIPDTLDKLLTVAKWGGLTFGALWLYRYVQENKGKLLP